MHFLSNEEKEKWIEVYVESETAGARKRVQDAEAAIRQEKEDAETTDNAGLMTREPETTFHEILDAIGHSVCNIITSDAGEDREDEDDEEPEQGHLSKDDEPGWVMGTITKRSSSAWRGFGRS